MKSAQPVSQLHLNSQRLIVKIMQTRVCTHTHILLLFCGMLDYITVFLWLFATGEHSFF